MNLKEECNKKGYTVSGAAKALGISRQNLYQASDWRKKELVLLLPFMTEINGIDIYALALALDIDAQSLLQKAASDPNAFKAIAKRLREFCSG